MNERYAVDPGAPATSQDLKILLDNFGLAEGRFIARYPVDWIAFVRQVYSEASDMEKARVTELLKRSRAKLLPCGEDFRRAASWGENALAVKHRARFSGIIGKEGNEFGFDALRDVLYGDDKTLPDSRGAHISMNAEEYARCSSPLFAFCPRVVLVDPYFWLHRADGSIDFGRRRILQALLEQAARSPVCEEFQLFVGWKVDRRQANLAGLFRDELLQVQERAGAGRLRVEPRLPTDGGHARYLLGAVGGIGFDHGFDFSKTKKNLVHWLSRSELDPLLRQYVL